jgi:DNA-binding NtrC family response regulator
MGATILLVDDDRDFCMLLESILDDKKFTIHSVHNLQEAIKLLPEIKPDIILLDNLLPDGKGIDSLDEIFALAPFAQVIMVSGDNNSRIRLRAVEHGVTRFISKPCSFQQITDAVEAML